MASLRGAALALVGGMAGSMMLGLTFAGCGDDSTTPTDGGTPDVVTMDSTTDVGTPDVVGMDSKNDVVDSGPDVKDAADSGDAKVDTGTDAPADVRDAGPDGDARADGDAAPNPDSGEAGPADAEAGTDAGSDAADAGDASDAGDGDAGPPAALLSYGADYSAAICTGLATCCGATFDLAHCENAFLHGGGYDNTLPLNANVYSQGHLTYDATQAALCKAALMAWPCGAMLTSVQNTAILTACHGVLGGTIPSGGACTDSFECATGFYCDLNTTHTCLPLVALGGTCTPGATFASPDEQCTNLATGTPARYCALYPAGGGPSTGTGTCAAAQANGATSLCTDLTSFISDYACSGLLCDLGSASCSATTANPGAPGGNFCTSNVLDAGGD